MTPAHHRIIESPSPNGRFTLVNLTVPVWAMDITLALILMLPLLTIFANMIGMLRGAAIGVLALGINWEQYFAQTRSALGLVDWGGGLVKAAVFGVIVAVVGCWQGMQCERSAAATSAVVYGIVLIVASDALFTILYTILGI